MKEDCVKVYLKINVIFYQKGKAQKSSQELKQQNINIKNCNRKKKDGFLKNETTFNILILIFSIRTKKASAKKIKRRFWVKPCYFFFYSVEYSSETHAKNK